MSMRWHPLGYGGNRTQWKPICWELGISRATANRRWQYGIAVITWRLNGKRVPQKRSMEFVICANR